MRTLIAVALLLVAWVEPLHAAPEGTMVRSCKMRWIWCPSFDRVHDSARLGVLSPAGIGFTSASWRA